MNASRTTMLAAAVLVAIGCGDSHPVEPALAAGAPTNRLLAAGAADPLVEAIGSFDAFVDFSTLSLTARGSNCLLRVSGTLVFSGTIEGVATGTTSALTFATCDDVIANPPGSFPDVFRSELHFTGSVDGMPAEGDLMYQGRAAPGGAIDAHLIFSRGMQGVLDVDGQVAVGGSYQGRVRRPH